jgi:hypothetical protein
MIEICRSRQKSDFNRVKTSFCAAESLSPGRKSIITARIQSATCREYDKLIENAIKMQQVGTWELHCWKPGKTPSFQDFASTKVATLLLIFD